MVESMKKVCMIDANLSTEERNLLSVGCKNIVAPRRASRCIIHADEQEEEQRCDTERLKLIKALCQKVEVELEEICNDAGSVVDTYLLPVPNNAEDIVFYGKIKGDCYRYLAEIRNGDERQNFADQSLKAYEDASELASTELATTHPTRLGIALNFAVFYREIKQDTEKACQVAKVAIDEAFSELDDLSEETYKNSTLTLQLLRDNLNLWPLDLPNEVIFHIGLV